MVLRSGARHAGSSSRVAPVAGHLIGTPPASDALVRLVGARRAELLGRLSSPTSTTALVSVTGWSAGSVSEHLGVLADNGLVAKRRVGRTVLYWRTEHGKRLLCAEQA